MNREILFRGKRLDNGEWVVGSLVKMGPAGYVHHFILPDYASAFYDIEVDPATVGQCTGLTDRAGKRIFEGDVAEFDAYGLHYKGVVTVIGGNFCILCGEKASPFLDHALERYRATVTGNIHDHPELLEGNTQ